jgi:hypothetical protein
LVDLNGDGNLDILSGSYSRQGRPMAGLFQVLWGEKDGGFRPAETLRGSDGEPLVIPAGEGDDVTDKICTRPFAADLDDDGKLDIVSGNFSGTFAFFAGEGDGRFAPRSTWLTGSGGPLRVDAHSDPFLVDWDGDGDLDLLSGSAKGGVFLFKNVGSKGEPKFGARGTLVPAAGLADATTVFGDSHVKGPGAATRVWVDDLDGDGKLDLLIGDNVTLSYPADGLDEASATEKLTAWNARRAVLTQAMRSGVAASENGNPAEALMALHREREKIVREDRTGFVWAMYAR